MIRVNLSQTWTSFGGLLLIAFVVGCSGKSSTDRSAPDGQSPSTDPSEEEANVEVQQSGGAIVITGMNVSGECYEGCAKRQFKPIATMSNGKKITLTKVNYRNLGATGDPVWQFSGENISCVKDGAAAFAPVCSSTNGSTAAVRVRFTIKTARFPEGLDAPAVDATISPDDPAAPANSGKKLYLFVTQPDYSGYLSVGLAAGLIGGDYTCKTALSSYMHEALGHATEAFVVLSSTTFPLYKRIFDATQLNVVQEETSVSIKFSRPIYSVSRSSMAPKISLIMPAGIDFMTGIRQRTEDLIGMTNKMPIADDATVRFLQGCNNWTSAQNSVMADTVIISPIAGGGGVVNSSSACNQNASVLCMAIDP